MSRHSDICDGDQSTRALKVLYDGVLQVETAENGVAKKCQDDIEKLTKARRNLSLQRAPAAPGELQRWVGVEAKDQRMLDLFFRNDATAKDYFLSIFLNNAVAEHLTNTLALNWHTNRVGVVSIMWNELKSADGVKTEMKSNRAGFLRARLAAAAFGGSVAANYLKQIIHLDLKQLQAASFIMLSPGGRTLIAIAQRCLPTGRATLNFALAALGIASLYHDTIEQFANCGDHLTTLMNMAPLLVAAPLLLQLFQPLDVTNDAARPGRKRGWSLLGDIVTAWGPVPHFGPGTEPGMLRIVLFITSHAFGGIADPYSSKTQHHRSQICIQFWCFMSAIHFLYEDRHTSDDADAHWENERGKTPKTSAAVKAFLLAAKDKKVNPGANFDGPMPPDFHKSWAKKLAVAWKADSGYSPLDVPPWAKEFFN